MVEDLVVENGTCPHCTRGKIIFCSEFKHWNPDHLMCDTCYSTYNLESRDEQLTPERLFRERSKPMDEVGKKNLLFDAKSLLSEDGENPEYDRAICELVGLQLGYSLAEGGAKKVAEEIGCKSTNDWKKWLKNRL
jgi:hypothetical protein